MRCPHCGSNEIDQTGKFDLTVIEPTEARHDFECLNCECLFQIVYEPVRTMVVQRPEPEVAKDEDLPSNVYDIFVSDRWVASVTAKSVESAKSIALREFDELIPRRDRRKLRVTKFAERTDQVLKPVEVTS